VNGRKARIVGLIRMVLFPGRHHLDDIAGSHRSHRQHPDVRDWPLSGVSVPR
jgi:hypothetical protein